MTEEEIKELIKKEVTLKGLVQGKPLNTKFKILKTVKEIDNKKYIFVFVFDVNEEINYQSEEELFISAFLILEEKLNILTLQQE